MSACSREDENQRKEGGLSDSGSTTHTHTHPLLSLQSGLGEQEAACVSNRSNVCARVCVYRVQCCAGVRERRLSLMQGFPLLAL